MPKLKNSLQARKLVSAVRSVTRSGHPLYVKKYLADKRSALKRTERKVKAKGLREWKRNNPQTVRSMVRDKVRGYSSS